MLQLHLTQIAALDTALAEIDARIRDLGVQVEVKAA